MVEDYNFYSYQIVLERDDERVFDRYAGKINIIYDYLVEIGSIYDIKIEFKVEYDCEEPYCKAIII